MAQEVGKRWNQTIVVEDRPGGSMNIGGEACAQAPNDGYTICILPPETLAYNKLLFKGLRYDPQRDFAPITNPFFTTQVLVVSAKLGVHSLAELAALSKAEAENLELHGAVDSAGRVHGTMDQVERSGHRQGAVPRRR